jgi:hypothetical protein
MKSSFIKIKNRRLNIRHVTRYELWWFNRSIKIRTTNDANITDKSQFRNEEISLPRLWVYMSEHPEHEPIKMDIGRPIDDYLKRKFGHVRSFISRWDDVYDHDKIQEYIWYRSEIGRRVVKYLDRRFL